LIPLVLGALGKSGGSSLTSGVMSNLLGGAIGQTSGGSGITKLLGGLLGGGAAAAGAAVSGVTGAAGSAAKAVTGSAAKTVAAGAAVTGAAAAATRGVASSARATVDEKRKKSPLMWLLPLLLIGALAIWGLTKCGKDDKKVAVDATEVVAETTPAVAAETVAAETVAVAAETVAAETVAAAAETTPAAPATEVAAVVETTVPATTTPAAVNAAGDAVSEDLTVYFDTNKSNIRADQQSKIDNAVAALKGAPAGTKVNLVGHADSRGNAAANEKLSQARSLAVETAIKAGLGAEASNVTFTSAFEGDTKPAADLALSRRVTVEIQK
jgi:outer membrane protein OmpA-like peptidoglycan-associated protein